MDELLPHTAAYKEDLIKARGRIASLSHLLAIFIFLFLPVMPIPCSALNFKGNLQPDHTSKSWRMPGDTGRQLHGKAEAASAPAGNVENIAGMELNNYSMDI